MRCTDSTGKGSSVAENRPRLRASHTSALEGQGEEAREKLSEQGQGLGPMNKMGEERGEQWEKEKKNSIDRRQREKIFNRIQ